MSLGGLYARVSEENGHLIDGNSCQKQLDGKSISKHVGVRPLVELCPLEKPLQTGVPAVAGAVMQTISSPEEIARIGVFDCAQKLDHMRRQGHVHWQSRFLLVQK